MACLGAMATGFRPASIALSQTRQPRNHHVQILDFEFSPRRLDVAPGDTITWTNLDIAPHSATAEDMSWDTGEIVKGDARRITVTPNLKPGFFCRFHPMMKGKLMITRS